MGQLLQKMPVARWLWEAHPAAINQSEMLQFAFHDMSENYQDEYPKHLEPALQRAMLYHLDSLTQQ